MPRGAFFHRGPAEVKRLVIEALQEHFAEHPHYSDADGHGVKIRNKYDRGERHKRQLVITTASASPQRLSLSADFGGQVHSSVVLGRLEGMPGSAVAWAVENPFQKVRPRPGIYLVEMDTDTTFVVHPFYAVAHEILYPFVDRDDGDKIKAVLKNRPVEAASEFLMLNERIPLEKDRDYTMDYDAGEITFLAPPDESLAGIRMLSAEYRFIGEPAGPFRVDRLVYNIDALPGIILTFSRKTSAGSQQAVVVRECPEYVADFWTGRWTVSVEISIYTQDPVEQDELAEEVAMVFWYWNVERWVDQGLSLVDPPSIGGGTEAEEDEMEQTVSFQNSVSLTVVVDWEGFVPVMRQLKTVNPVGYGLALFESAFTSAKKDLDARPDGEFGNILDRMTLPGKGVQLERDLSRYFSGPDDPKLGQLYVELLNFNPTEAAGALNDYYDSVDPTNPNAPDDPINLPERVPVSEFKDVPTTDATPGDTGVFSKSTLLTLDELPKQLRDELRRSIIRGC